MFEAAMMRLLLDTHVLLWALGEPDRLPAELRRMLENIDNEPWFSAASIWEIAIKSGLGRFDFRVSAQRILPGKADLRRRLLHRTPQCALPISRRTTAIRSIGC